MRYNLSCLPESGLLHWNITEGSLETPDAGERVEHDAINLSHYDVFLRNSLNTCGRYRRRGATTLFDNYLGQLVMFILRPTHLFLNPSLPIDG